MKNRSKLKAMRSIAGIIALAAVLALSFAACDDGSGGDSGGNSGGGGGGGDGLNGTWVWGNERMVLSNGSFTVWENNVESVKGSYSASGSNITMTVTQIYGAYLMKEAPELQEYGLSRTQWYTQSSLRTAFINFFVSQGMPQADAAAIYDQNVAPGVAQGFAPITGTVSGNTITIAGDTYIRQ